MTDCNFRERARARVDIKTEDDVRLNGWREAPVPITDDGRVLTETVAVALWLRSRGKRGRGQPRFLA